MLSPSFLRNSLVLLFAGLGLQACGTSSSNEHASDSKKVAAAVQTLRSGQLIDEMNLIVAPTPKPKRDPHGVHPSTPARHSPSPSPSPSPVPAVAVEIGRAHV